MATTKKSAKVAKSGAKKQRAKKSKGKKVAPPKYMALLLDFTHAKKNKALIQAQIESFEKALKSQGVVIAKARTP